MSAIDRINKKRKELELQEQVKAGKITQQQASMQRIESLTNELRQNNNKIDYADTSQIIAPTKSTKTSSNDGWGKGEVDKPWYKQIFKSSEAYKNVGSDFDDGYDLFDGMKTLYKGVEATVKTAGATAADVGLNLVEGVARVGEVAGTLGAYGVAQVADWAGKDKYAQSVRDKLTGKEENVFGAKGAPVSYWLNEAQKKIDKNSVLGSTGDEISSLVGYTGGLVTGGNILGGLTKTGKVGSVATNAAGKTVGTGITANLGNVGVTVAGHTLNVPTLAFVGGAAGGLNEAYSKEGVTDTQAWVKGLGAGAIEGITEGLFGMFGVGGSSLDDAASKYIVGNLKSGIGKALANSGVKASGEALEEFLSYAGNQGLDWLIDKASKESSPDFYNKWDREEVGEQMGMAFISSGITQGGGTVVNANTQANIAIKNAEAELGRSLTAKEKASVRDQVLSAVVDNEVNQDNLIPTRNEVNNTTTQEVQTNSLVEAPSNTLNTVNNDKITKSIEELQEDLKTAKGSETRSEIATQIKALQEGYTSVNEYKTALENERQNSLIAPVKSEQIIDNNIQPNYNVIGTEAKYGNEETTSTNYNNEINEGTSPSTNIKEYWNDKRTIRSTEEGFRVNEYNTDKGTVVTYGETAPSINYKDTYNIVKNAKSTNPYGAFVDLHEEAEYQNMKNFSLEDGSGNISVAEDGNIVSVAKNPNSTVKGASKQLLLTALENGGTKLDNFDGFLTMNYQDAGFIPVARVKFNAEYAPEGWNFERDGQPDVIAMMHNGESTEQVRKNYGKYGYTDLDSLPYMEYDEAMAYRDSLIEERNSSSETSKESNSSIPTKEELDKLEDIRQNKSGSEYASAFFDLRDKYGQANLYKGINEYNSNAKKGSVSNETTQNVQEDIAPIKEAAEDLKQAQKELSNQLKELKSLKEEIAPIKGMIEDIKATTENDLEAFTKQYQEDIKNLKEEIAPIRDNLTQEESKELDYLEMMPFGLTENEEARMNDLRAKEVNMPDSEEAFAKEEYETPEAIIPAVAKEEIKNVLNYNDAQAAELYDKIANSNEYTKEDLAKDIENILKEGNYTKYTDYEVKDIRNFIRSTKLDSSHLKDEFPSMKEYNAFRKSNFGKLKLGNDGQQIDSFYQELTELYPQYFSDEVNNTADQLEAIADFMNNNPTVSIVEGEAIPQEIIDSYANKIYNDVLNAEVTKQLNEDLDAFIDSYNAGQELEDTNNPFVVDENKFKTRKQMQRRLDTVNKQIDRMSDLSNRMYEAMNKYEARIAEVQEQIAVDRYNGIGTNSLDEYLNEQILQRVYEQAAPVAEKYDKYHNKLQELTEERNALQDKIEDTPEKKSKKQIQRELVDKTGIIEEGLDNANRMSMFMLNNTDPIRVQEMMFGQEIGSKINEEYFQKVKDNTSEKIRFQNEQRSLIKDLGIKARSKESAAVQKYGEKQVVDSITGTTTPYGDAELAAEFPNVETQEKIKNAAKVMRGLYDNYIDQANGVLTGLGYDAIPKRPDYFRHFNELSDKFSQWGIPLNLNDMKANDLPTDINGLTADFTPGKNFFASALHRTGNKTTYDAITGIDGYLEGIGNLIYHTEDIQRLRGLENYVRETYGQQHGFDNFEQLTDEQKVKRIQAIQDNRLSNYAAWLHEYTNQLAGKKAMVDRAVESVTGRRIFSILDTANKQVGANMIGFNISSSLTNAIAGVQALAKTNKIAAVKGLADSVKNIFHNDGFVEKNGFLTSRFGSERISKTNWQKISDAGYMFMSGTDNFISNFVVRSKFNELKAKGLSDSEAHAEAGKFASKLMADRSQGGQATLYNSKVLGILTKFQYEVNNQLYSMFYDTYQESKAKANGSAVKMTGSMASTLGQLAIFTHIFGTAFEKMAGYNPTFDIIGILAKALGFDDDEDSEDTLKDNLGQAFEDLLKALPYSSIFTGGRVPIGEALPFKELITGKDSYGNEKSRVDTLKETAPYWLLPTGYGQIKKTTGGLGLYDDSLPVAGSYTDSGNLRFTVEDTTENRIKSAIFGKWSNEEAQKYIDSGFKTIKASNVDELKDLGMKSSEYRKLKENITKAGKTNQEKVDYITSLDNLSDSQKNILINNILDRKYDVDASNYSDFSSYEEFDYSYKNPEKYNWLKENNISYTDYVSSDESKEMYDYAYKNPDKYELGKAATNNFSDYYTYKQDINDMSADKDSEGKSINGSRKTKVISYVNGLDLSIPQKAMIIRTEYSSFDDYNDEIVSYVDSLDVSYDKKVSILESLDMKVLEDGSVRW